MKTNTPVYLIQNRKDYKHMIKPISPVSPVSNKKQKNTHDNTSCKQPKTQKTYQKPEAQSLLTKQEKAAVKCTNGKLDIDISKISTCTKTSMDDCEANCGRYSSCSTIAYANDILANYEKECMIRSCTGKGSTCKTMNHPETK